MTHAEHQIQRRQYQKQRQQQKQEGQQHLSIAPASELPEKQQQSKQYKDEKQQKKFKSEKLSPEDAERVMAELNGKERELQVKLKQQHGNQSTNQKDW